VSVAQPHSASQLDIQTQIHRELIKELSGIGIRPVHKMLVVKYDALISLSKKSKKRLGT